MEAHSDLLRNEAAPMQMFTTAGLLLEFVDKKVSVTLRDSTAIVGVMRSFDQFGSFVLQDAVEKIYCDDVYAERALGVYIVRSDYVAMVGDFDLRREDQLEKTFRSKYRQVSFDEAEALLSAKRDALLETRKEEALRGLKKGLIGSVNTANPYHF